jgi:hypothetical protein
LTGVLSTLGSSCFLGVFSFLFFSFFCAFSTFTGFGSGITSGCLSTGASPLGLLSGFLIEASGFGYNILDYFMIYYHKESE